jgi:predicted glutamine amidotransferase
MRRKTKSVWFLCADRKILFQFFTKHANSDEVPIRLANCYTHIHITSPSTTSRSIPTKYNTQYISIMCQILGMNCARPTDFSIPFRGLCERGGCSDIHSHGFGLAVYEGAGIRTFLDTLPAAHSPLARFLQHYPIATHNMIAHIRYATTGCVALQNVHPFHRELWGITWTFAHNGQVPKYDDTTPPPSQPLLGAVTKDDMHYHPNGETDSEAVFCQIMNAMKAEFDQIPTLPILHRFLYNLCEEIIGGEEGTSIFNFVLGCGERTLFAYSWPGRRPGSSVWNGLYYLLRETPSTTPSSAPDNCTDSTSDRVPPISTTDRVALVATKPLTDEEGWVEFKRGQLLMFNDGSFCETPECCDVVEQEGRGLVSNYFEHKAARESSLLTRKRNSPRIACDMGRPASPRSSMEVQSMG